MKRDQGNFFNCFIFFRYVLRNLGSIRLSSLRLREDVLLQRYLPSYISFLAKYLMTKWEIILSSCFISSQFMLLWVRELAFVFFCLNNSVDLFVLQGGLGIEGKQIVFRLFIIYIMIYFNKVIQIKDVYIFIRFSFVPARSDASSTSWSPSGVH